MKVFREAFDIEFDFPIGFKEIEVGFPSASAVEFDFLRRLVDDNLMSGAYTVQFDGQYLATGTYFYILRSGEQMMKRKMVLIK